MIFYKDVKGKVVVVRMRVKGGDKLSGDQFEGGMFNGKKYKVVVNGVGSLLDGGV